MAVQISNQVSYKREGYSFTGGLVLALDEGTNRALVQWTDCLGHTRQMFVGVEFLTVIETAAASTAEAAEAA